MKGFLLHYKVFFRKSGFRLKRFSSFRSRNFKTWLRCCELDFWRGLLELKETFENAKIRHFNISTLVLKREELFIFAAQQTVQIFFPLWLFHRQHVTRACWLGSVNTFAHTTWGRTDPLLCWGMPVCHMIILKNMSCHSSVCVVWIPTIPSGAPSTGLGLRWIWTAMLNFLTVIVCEPLGGKLRFVEFLVRSDHWGERMVVV